MPPIDKDKYLCIGCGACAYRCPKQCITYSENIVGQYVPVVDYDSCIECKLCEKVCPVYSEDIPEKTSKYNDIVGNYLSSYKGFDKAFRKTSASGGLLTAVLYQLIKVGEIDYAVCVRNKSKGLSFYSYEFIKTPEELRLASKSAYYPLEMSDMLRHIKEKNGKYALVVLPCQAKAIRTSQKHDKILRERIKYLLGLVCGGVPGKAMVEYVANDNGKDILEIRQVSFRDKNSYDLNRNYSVTLSVTEQKSIRSNFMEGAFGFSYLNKLFHYKGCNLCDDIFAEYADAAFMDAWLPEHNQDIYGTSICIFRNEKLNDILADYFSRNDNCEEVDISLSIKAQNSVGLIQRKKKQSYFKRRLYRRIGYLTPDSGHHHISIKENLKFLIRSIQELFIQNKSFKEWNKYKRKEISFESYKSTMIKFINRIKKI